MKKIIFRKASSRDVNATARLLSHLGYSQDMSRFSQVFERVLKEECLEIILATAEERCLGLITLRTTMSLRLTGPQVTIEELVVAPEARGKRLGTRLVELAKERARQCRAVLLEVHISTSRKSFKRHFYAKKGFVRAESCVFRWVPNGRAFEEQGRDLSKDQQNKHSYA